MMETTTVPEKFTSKELVTDQDIRWCPGCGDYSILKQAQTVIPELGIARENIVFVSGIGCSSRFPYYMNTYRFHNPHRRPPPPAAGRQPAPPRPPPPSPAPRARPRRGSSSRVRSFPCGSSPETATDCRSAETT